MKKSSSTIIITVVAIVVLGVSYITYSFYEKNHNEGSSRVENIQNEDAKETISEDTTSGEFKYVLADGESITAKYLKTGSNIKIYSISPVEDKKNYNISQSGNAAVYLGKDGHICVLYNDGTQKKITPDIYQSIDKQKIQKDNPGYIWASDPVITSAGNIRFVSNLPDTSPSPKKSIWEINIENGNMRNLYTPVSDAYRILGYRDDGRLLIADGDTMAGINLMDGIIQNFDIKSKHIVSLSPDGTRILYMKKDGKNIIDYSKLYMMDSYGNKAIMLPGIEGYNVTETGAWGSGASRYALIIKSASNGKDKIAILNFDEQFIDIDEYTPDVNVIFSNKSKLKWSEDDIISVDTGEDIVTVQIK